MFTAALGWDVTTRDTFLSLADARLTDAQLLLAAHRYGAAYYLAGYAVECALKAKIAWRFRHAEFPDPRFVRDVHTHALRDLVRHADLSVHLEEKRRSDLEFATNWTIVSGWSVDARYEMIDPITAHDMVRAVGIEPSGVMPWLKGF